MKTSGNTILITGGGSGIGAALAQRLHDRGDTVIVAGRRADALARTCEGRERMHAITLDVDSAAGVADFVQRLLREHPAVNVLINNAGISTGASLLTGSMDDVRREMDTHYFGTLAATRAFVPAIEANGGGSILNVLSVLSWAPAPAGR